MGFIDVLEKAVAVVQQAHGIQPMKRVVDFGEYVETGRGAMGEYQYGDIESLSRVYDNLVWVYRCVTSIAENISGLPTRVIVNTPKQETVDVSDLRDFDVLLRNPNPFQTRYDFMMESISRLLLQGEMFWRIQYDNRGRPEMVFADWRSDEVEIIPSPEGYIERFVRHVNGKRYEFTIDEVFYVRFFNPNSSLRGVSPLHASTHAAMLDLSAIDYNKRFFRQGMKFTGVFTTDKHLSETEARRLKERLKEIYSGVQNMWDPAVLWGGLKFEPLNSMTLRDADFAKLREMNRQEIAVAFGVPLEVLGIGKATYENLRYARKLFWAETLIPMIRKISEAVTKFLLPRFTPMARVEFQFDTSSVPALKEDITARRQDFEVGFRIGAVTPNEVRQHVFGFDPIDSPEMNMTYLPANLIPAASTEQNGKGKIIDTNWPDPENDQ